MIIIKIVLNYLFIATACAVGAAWTCCAPAAELSGTWNTFDSCFPDDTPYTFTLTQQGAAVTLAPTVGTRPACSGRLENAGLTLSCSDTADPAGTYTMSGEIIDNATIALTRPGQDNDTHCCTFRKHTVIDPAVEDMHTRVNRAEALYPMGQRTPRQMRRYMMRSNLWTYLFPATPVASVSKVCIPGPGGSIPARVYVPGGDAPFPVVVFFHGGGWVVGSSREFDHYSRMLAAEACALVLSVDYRRAPEHTFPAAHEDAFAALEWAAENAARFGGDPSLLCVAGESAGGSLAIASCRRARDVGSPQVMLQVLMSPITNVSEMNTDSYYRYATGYMLTKEWMEAFRGYYLPDARDWSDPLVSPLPAEDFAGLPPAFVITAEYDVLRDEGEAFARLLADAGVAVRHYRCGGVIHGFTTAMVDFIEQSRHAVRLTADEIKLAVGR